MEVGVYEFLFAQCRYLRESEHQCTQTYDSQPIEKGEFEFYGGSSSCIEYMQGDKIIPQCHRAACLENGSMMIGIGPNNYTCTNKSQLVEISADYKIKCPDVTDFCRKLTDRCDESCYANGAGICLKNKKCLCFEG